MSKDIKELVKPLSIRSVFQTEGTARAKALW